MNSCALKGVSRKCVIEHSKVWCIYITELLEAKIAVDDILKVA